MKKTMFFIFSMILLASCNNFSHEISKKDLKGNNRTITGLWKSTSKYNSYDRETKSKMKIETTGSSLKISYKDKGLDYINNFSGKKIGKDEYITPHGKLYYNPELDVIYYRDQEYIRINN